MKVGEDLRLTAETISAALGPALDTADWSARALPTDWSCRDTLDHVANALCGYATSLATERTRGRRHHPRNGDQTATAADLLEIGSSFAAVLAAVAESVGPEVRAFHPAGMADRDGFVAMGCDELLVHAGDIAAALGIGFAPPTELAARVLRRLFPWAPTDADPWSALLWSNGRVALGGRERLSSDWWWHCVPLSEWQGARHERTRLDPPGWR
jgi:uncharacterized protein (TIGR03083 family)